MKYVFFLYIKYIYDCNFQIVDWYYGWNFDLYTLILSFEHCLNLLTSDFLAITNIIFINDERVILFRNVDNSLFLTVVYIIWIYVWQFVVYSKFFRYNSYDCIKVIFILKCNQLNKLNHCHGVCQKNSKSSNCI